MDCRLRSILSLTQLLRMVNQSLLKQDASPLTQRGEEGVSAHAGLGIIRPVKSPWSSPLDMVPKTTLTVPSSNLRKCHSTLLAPPSSVTSPRVPTDPLCLVFDMLHSMSHPGINTTQRLIMSRLVWPHVNRDVGQ